MAYVDVLSCIVNMLLFIVNLAAENMVAKNHAWFYYFDDPPNLSEERLTNVNMKVEQGGLQMLTLFQVCQKTIIFQRHSTMADKQCRW